MSRKSILKVDRLQVDIFSKFQACFSSKPFLGKIYQYDPSINAYSPSRKY